MGKQRKRRHSPLIISTTLMILLLIVSISTATFAWFSANTVVGTNTLSFTAEHGGDATITITWDECTDPDKDYTGENEITFAASHVISPAIPLNEPDSTTLSTAFEGSFYGATIGIPKGSTSTQETFNSNGLPAKPFQSSRPDPVTNAATSQKHFYITNHGTTNVTMDASVVLVQNASNDNAPLLRVALFVGASPASLSYLGTLVPHGVDLGTTNLTHYGQIVQGADPTNFSTIPHNTILQFPVVAGRANRVVVTVVAWYDGVYLDNLHQGKEANIELMFRGS